MEKLKEAHKSQDITAIDAAMKEINDAWHAASEDMYKATQNAQQENPSGDANANTNQDNGEVKDVDFEEVK